MPILFEFYESPSKDPAEETKFHARPVTFKTVNTKQIAREIQFDSSLTEPDIKAVLTALSDKIVYHLSNSERVHLEGIGYFQATLKHVREIDPDKTRAQSVWFKSVAFRADKELKEKMADVPTERSEIKRHSAKLSNEAVDKTVREYIAENGFITRKILQDNCGFRLSTAIKHIKRMIGEGKIKNVNTNRQPVYVKGEE